MSCLGRSSWAHAVLVVTFLRTAPSVPFLRRLYPLTQAPLSLATKLELAARLHDDVEGALS